MLKKFYQWLYIGKGEIPSRPKFTIEKVINYRTFHVKPECGDKCGLQYPSIWFALKARFLHKHGTKWFNNHYYFGNSWVGKWRGVPVLKCPADLFTYQEILYETRPDIVIECGTANGGTAYFIASVMDMIKNGKVLSIDITPHRHPVTEERDIFRPFHERIRYLQGYDDVDIRTIGYLKKVLKAHKSVMVILDSDHQKEHVLKQLKIYSELVTKGHYMIVEDTNLGYSVDRKEYKNNSPLDAIKEWIVDHPEFRIDYERERQIVTANPFGYLKKTSE
jgi:cephalosporin hydroxylase